MEFCPKCQLVNPDGALRCDCGYDFATGTLITGANTQWPQEAIRYKLHFLILVLEFTAFCVVIGPYTQSGTPYTSFIFGLIGVLHAIAIVSSMREHGWSRLDKSALFIILAAIWSYVTPTLALYSSILWIPLLDRGASSRFNFLAFYVPGSAIGASGYWVLIRMFWLRSLRVPDWLKTVSLCVTATLVSTVIGEFLNPLVFFPLNTAAWWSAFSISLYWSESRYVASLVRKSG
jgi:hypothetical protein